MSGKPNGSGKSHLKLSSGKKSAGEDLENLDINLDDELGQQSHLGLEQQPSDLLMSEIRVGNQDSVKKGEGDADDIAEMEKLLKSGGAFGGKSLSKTFKKIRGEIAAAEAEGDLDLGNDTE